MPSTIPYCHGSGVEQGTVGDTLAFVIERKWHRPRHVATVGMTSLALGALVLGGCAGQDPEPESGPQEAPADVALDDPVTTELDPAAEVELLEPGSGDLEVRTFAPTNDELPPVTMDFDSTSSVTADGTPQEQHELPRRTATFDQGVESDVNGAQRATLAFSSLTPDAEDTGLDELLASAAGFEVTLVREPAGQITSSTLTAPTQARGVARQSVEQMAGALAESGVILPDEPIGEGARWRVTRPNDDAVAPEMTLTYSLIRIDGDELTVAVDGTAPKSSDTLDLPAEDGGEAVSLDVAQYSSTASGELTFSLTGAAPTDGELKYETTARYRGDSDAVTETSATRKLVFRTG